MLHPRTASKGISQRRLAKLANVNRTTLRNIEVLAALGYELVHRAPQISTLPPASV
jgi:hypothetical protein